MKKIIRDLIKKIPGIMYIYTLRHRYPYLKFKTAEDVFTNHYMTNEWTSKESISGPGSTIEYTENIRKELPGLFNKLNIKNILDAPCGDYNWFKLINRGDEIQYLGGDIVKPLIINNQNKYGNSNTSFTQLNITKDALPKVDLWICRDCLFHLSNKDVSLAIEKFLKSDIEYILTSAHTHCTSNSDIPTGSFRLLNLELPPFNFPKPLLSIDDWIKGYPVRTLNLWSREQILNK